MDSPAQPDRLLKHLALVFGLALVFYVAFFFGLERFRVRKGPWQVAFDTDAAGAPIVEISQPRLGLARMRLAFPGENAAARSERQIIHFDQPTKTNLPYGQLKFLDTTFLPGTVTMDLFGHEVELLPRVLILDKQEHSWRSDTTLVVKQK